MTLTASEVLLHEKIMDVKNKIQTLEASFIELLSENDRIKLFRKFDCPSLFIYAVKILGLSESVAYSYISVARKASQVSALKTAIREKEISVSKASRIVSVLNSENAALWIEFAKTHSKREVEVEVVKMNSKAQAPDKAKPISKDLFEIGGCVSKEVHQKYIRTQSLLASKKGKNVGFEDILDAALSEFIERNDPLAKDRRRREKAERQAGVATATKTECQLNAETANISTASEPKKVTRQQLCPGRVKLLRPSAVQKQAILARDGGRCVHVDASGNRCSSERWLEVHHVIPLSQGGANDPKNLTTLCGFHHDLVHQLTLPLEGQISWLRSPATKYRVDGHRFQLAVSR